MGEFDTAQNVTAADPAIPDDRPIWVVVVHGNIPADPPPARPVTTYAYDVYTEVLDAPTGTEIMTMIGIAADR